MKNFLLNIKAGLTSKAKSDSGDPSVSTIFLIATFVIIAVIVFGGWISTAVFNKGADIAECIEGSNAIVTDGKSAVDKCEKANHAGKGDNSFQKSETYKKRFGGS